MSRKQELKFVIWHGKVDGSREPQSLGWATEREEGGTDVSCEGDKVKTKLQVWAMSNLLNVDSLS